MRPVALRAALAVAALVAVTASALPAAAAPAPAPAVGWTKTYTEAILLLKLRLPCRQVRSTAGCSVELAQQRLALSQRRLAACKSRITASAAGAACKDTDVAATARTNLTEIKRGFPLRTADCIGGSKTRLAGLRYGVFRCSITVEDDANPGGPVVVSGRLLVTVTGKTTFVWQAI
jgi:hypothetical protein